MRICGTCGINKKNNEFYDNPNPICKSCSKKAAKKRLSRIRKENRKEIKKLKNLTCEVCGIKHNDLGFFEFHHTSPKDKSFGVMSQIGRSWEKLKEEIDKCIYLCPNCHKEEHLKMKRDNNDKEYNGRRSASRITRMVRHTKEVWNGIRSSIGL